MARGGDTNLGAGEREKFLSAMQREGHVHMLSDEQDSFAIWRPEPGNTGAALSDACGDRVGERRHLCCRLRIGEKRHAQSVPKRVSLSSNFLVSGGMIRPTVTGSWTMRGLGRLAWGLMVTPLHADSVATSANAA